LVPSQGLAPHPGAAISAESRARVARRCRDWCPARPRARAPPLLRLVPSQDLAPRPRRLCDSSPVETSLPAPGSAIGAVSRPGAAPAPRRRDWCRVNTSRPHLAAAIGARSRPRAAPRCRDWCPVKMSLPGVRSVPVEALRSRRDHESWRRFSMNSTLVRTAVCRVTASWSACTGVLVLEAAAHGIRLPLVPGRSGAARQECFRKDSARRFLGDLAAMFDFHAPPDLLRPSLRVSRACVVSY